jgi:asparagine synthetase B (glutamine-hydrolysing)
MKNILPDKIMNRQDKIGFDNPCAEWFREAKFKEFILSILNSNSFRNLQYFDYKRCLKIYQIHLKKKIDASRQIWKWINVSLWQKKFIA